MNPKIVGIILGVVVGILATLSFLAFGSILIFTGFLIVRVAFYAAIGYLIGMLIEYSKKEKGGLLGLLVGFSIGFSLVLLTGGWSPAGSAGWGPELEIYILDLAKTSSILGSINRLINLSFFIPTFLPILISGLMGLIIGIYWGKRNKNNI